MMSSNRTMAGRPPPSDDPSRRLEDAGGGVRRAQALGGELVRGPHAVPRENEDRGGADGQSEENVDGLVADHERGPEIESELTGCAQPQPGEGLGATAGLAGH